MNLRKFFAWLLLALLVSWLPALQAHAAEGDQVDTFRINYVVTPDGVLHVTETIVYRFGDSSGRHGIYRDLLVREPYVDDRSKDQRYAVSQVTVSSPSGASDELNQETLGAGARTEVLRLRVGSGDQIVGDATATYVIRYQVRGALRHFKDHSELYWDATGTQWQAVLRNVSVTATVPGGVTKVACFAGKRGSKASCATHNLDGGKAVFAQPSVPAGQQVTIVAAIRAGKVRNDKPLVVQAPTPPPTEIEPTDEPGDEVPPDELPPDIGDGTTTDDGATPGVLAAAGAAVVLLPVGAAVQARRSRRDERYAGLPPGAVPPMGQNVAIGKDTLKDDQIPVGYAPPKVPVAEAGLLLDGVIDTTETAATLIDLAVRGAVRIESAGPTATLVDPARLEHEHERVLLTRMFGDNLEPGATRALGRAKTGEYAMRSAHVKMTAAVREQVAARRWYNRMPSGATSAGCVPLVLATMAGMFSGFVVATSTGRTVDGLLTAVAVIVGGLSLYGVLKARSRGIRTAEGRAVTDQVVGFRTYLSTAEADQLRFEEGEDIFGRYLPWAIVFGIVDRWRQVCAELVAAGRIPAETTWYAGSSYVESALLIGAINGLSRSFDAPPSAPSSSSGNSSSFGGGSSFDFGGGGGSSSGFSSSSSDGGSSGGGGGGGGGGSW